eukprot:scaffold107675_cov24-Tisochrysis_lutea.AAC.3
MHLSSRPCATFFCIPTKGNPAICRACGRRSRGRLRARWTGPRSILRDCWADTGRRAAKGAHESPVHRHHLDAHVAPISDKEKGPMRCEANREREFERAFTWMQPSPGSAPGVPDAGLSCTEGSTSARTLLADAVEEAQWRHPENADPVVVRVGDEEA